MRRSRVETAIHIVLKGDPEGTEKQLQAIYDAITLPIPTPKVDEKVKKVKESKEVKEKMKEEVKKEKIDTPEPVTSSAYANPFEPIQTEKEAVKFEDEVEEIEDLEEEEDEFEDY